MLFRKRSYRHFWVGSCQMVVQFRKPVVVTGLLLRETFGIKMQGSSGVFLQSLPMVRSTFATISSENDSLPHRSSSWITVRPAANFLHHLWTFFEIHVLINNNNVKDKVQNYHNDMVANWYDAYKYTPIDMAIVLKIDVQALKLCKTH